MVSKKGLLGLSYQQKAMKGLPSQHIPGRIPKSRHSTGSWLSWKGLAPGLALLLIWEHGEGPLVDRSTEDKHTWERVIHCVYVQVRSHSIYVNPGSFLHELQMVRLNWPLSVCRIKRNTVSSHKSKERSLYQWCLNGSTHAAGRGWMLLFPDRT